MPPAKQAKSTKSTKQAKPAAPGASASPPRRARAKGQATPPPRSQPLEGQDAAETHSEAEVDFAAAYLEQLRAAAERPTQLADGPDTAEATWIRSSGLTPLEFLVETYRDPFMEAKHRVAAARAVLEYAHKRLPVPLRLGNDPESPLMPGGAVPDLSKLSDDELEQFATLMQKMNAGGSIPSA